MEVNINLGFPFSFITILALLALEGQVAASLSVCLAGDSFHSTGRNGWFGTMGMILALAPSPHCSSSEDTMPFNVPQAGRLLGCEAGMMTELPT